MSLDWTIDAETRLVVIVADGDVTRGEMDTLLDDLIAKEALAYRKLFDGSRGDTLMNSEELLMLGVRFRAIHTQGRMGPLAVVVAEHKAELVARVLGMLAVADRPMRVFRAPALARRWLESLAR
ncbi:MAG: hypothetical protein WCK95_14820 [Alphaproteobacteria bacterium]|jgi:hypothetical protein